MSARLAVQNRRHTPRMSVCLNRQQARARTLATIGNITSYPWRHVTRRQLGGLLVAVSTMGAVGMPRLVQAQSPVSLAEAQTFVLDAGQKLMAVLNGPYGGREKRQLLRRLINANVDTYGIARFAMGQYWRIASETQRAEFVQMFPALLSGVLRQALGGYPGVQFTVDRSIQLDDAIEVWTSIIIPESAPRGVGWVVGSTAEGLRIIDVVAEGASLRINQRDNVATLVAQHQNSIDAMIAAMEHDMATD